MKIKLLFLTLLMTVKFGFSQNLTLNELIKLRSMSTDNVTDFLTAKGFNYWNTTEKNGYSTVLRYRYLGADKIPTLLSVYRNSGTTYEWSNYVLYTTYDKNKYLAIKKEIENYPMKLINNKTEGSFLNFTYLGKAYGVIVSITEDVYNKDKNGNNLTLYGFFLYTQKMIETTLK